MATLTKKKPAVKENVSVKTSGAGKKITKTAVSTDDIAKKAYELYQQRGGSHGCDWLDWFEAERILRQKT